MEDVQKGTPSAAHDRETAVTIFMNPVERYERGKFPGLDELLEGLEERARTFDPDDPDGDQHRP